MFQYLPTSLYAELSIWTTPPHHPKIY